MVDKLGWKGMTLYTLTLSIFCSAFIGMIYVAFSIGYSVGEDLINSLSSIATMLALPVGLFIIPYINTIKSLRG